MNTKFEKYDPEDLESLMFHKSFMELLPEERDFVLRHLDSQEEYESMRHTLLLVSEKRTDDWIKPRKETKKTLMAMYAEERKKGWLIWLNGFLGFREDARVPAFALASIVICLAVGSVLLLTPAPDEPLAELKPKEQTELPQEEKASPKKEETAKKESLEKATAPAENSIELELKDEAQPSRNFDIAEAKENPAPATIEMTEADDEIQDFEDLAELDMDVQTERDGVEEEEIQAVRKESASRASKQMADLVNKSKDEEEAAPESEFYFDNSMGNTATQTLSDIEVIASSSDASISQGNAGALITLAENAETSEKASESLGLIDILYTAY